MRAGDPDLRMPKVAGHSQSSSPNNIQGSMGQKPCNCHPVWYQQWVPPPSTTQSMARNDKSSLQKLLGNQNIKPNGSENGRKKKDLSACYQGNHCTNRVVFVFS